MIERGQSAREGSPSDRFEVQGTLGEGGMGVVYRAWDRTLGKAVALKRMREIGAASVHRLKSEFRARSALQHKNLVQLYELVIDGDDCFFTMELIEGSDLEAWVRHGGSSGRSRCAGYVPAISTDREARASSEVATVAETPGSDGTDRELASRAGRQSTLRRPGRRSTRRRSNAFVPRQRSYAAGSPCSTTRGSSTAT